jgi:hypothetical protein
MLSRGRETKPRRPWTMMALLKRIVASDEELGKRDDEYKKPAARGASSGSWSRIRAPLLRSRRKRLLATVIFAVLVWACLYRLPQNERRSPFNLSSFRGAYDTTHEEVEPTGAPPREAGRKDAVDQHYYEGTIRFFRLSSS